MKPNNILAIIPARGAKVERIMVSPKNRGNILAIVPARSGSKSIQNKTVRVVAGKPLLAYSIEHALASSLISRTIVSTDSAAYAEIARQYGAEVPFLRPPEISQDDSTDLETFVHALDWLREKENYVPEICVHLRPTNPVRRVEDIDTIIQILLDNPDIDSVRSVTAAPNTPFKMWFRDEDGFLSPVVMTDIKEPYNLPRQLLPQTFLQNASIDAVRTSVITEMKSMTGERIFGYVMDDIFDVDNEDQLQRAEQRLTKDLAENEQAKKSGFNLDELKTFCFDIDGIVATIVPGNQYNLAKPKPQNIRIINTLYEWGHHIVLFTARGSETGIEWTEVTRKQLAEWGVRYHELLFGKPAADYYVDDKLLSIEQLGSLLKG